MDTSSAFAASLAMVEVIGCEDILQKPVARPAIRLLLARILNIETAVPVVALPVPALDITGCHLLYAEDSLTSQKIMKRMLEKAGVRVTLVDNGKAAVEAALDDCSQFDCILMAGLLVASIVTNIYHLCHLCCCNPAPPVLNTPASDATLDAVFQTPYTILSSGNCASDKGPR